MSAPPTPKPRFKRRYALVLLAIVGFLAAYGLNLHWKGLLPRGEGFVLWKRFFNAALHPAITYESANVVQGTPPFLLVVLKSIRSGFHGTGLDRRFGVGRPSLP